ncbi:2465_t:CDS:2 [Gigaspora rosea]|nr:2465_t:CDS:2 [Gigaspora rosea]
MDRSIGLLFGHVVETYFLLLPIVKDAQGAINFKGWTMINGITKLTNHLDDRLELIEKGQNYIIQIWQGLVPDLCIWHWHIPANISIQHESAITCLNLSRTVRDQDQNFPLNSLEHYYQLTVSDNMWLEQARDYGLFCFGINTKYNLNNNCAPINTLVVEDEENWGMPIGFALSNKENMHTIRLAVEAIRANIPCKNINCDHPYEYIALPNNKGFKSLAFKIIGRCRSISEAKEIAIKYKNFINLLPISTQAKAFFILDLEENWLYKEWILGFIDSRRLPSQKDEPHAKLRTTNNFTERINRTIEKRFSENCGQLVFSVGFVIYWNSHTIEHQNGLCRLQSDVIHCINQGKLKVLQNNILEVSDNPDFYMFEDSEAQEASKMIKKLAKKHIVPILPDYYLVNYITGECTCLDFIRHGSFCDCCKYGHAARIYISIKANENSIDQIKRELIQ